MVDWKASMQQTFEYYVVDPATWRDSKRIDDVTTCTITRDLESETLASATIETNQSIGECYIRVYMITIQNGVKEKHPLGTFLVQTPSTSFDGKTHDNSLDMYSPLLELKEKLPPIGYYVPKDTNILNIAYRLSDENARAPVLLTEHAETVFADFVADTDDTWASFLTDLLANAKYRFDLDEMGRILFAPDQDAASLRPVWTYTDNNSSILLPDVSLNHDLYRIPNAVEVIVSNSGSRCYSKIVNDDPNSPISTINRGREILHRDTEPDLIGNPTQDRVDEYARKLLREASTLEYTLSYTHGYCPVRIGDCIRLNYTRAGLNDIKAKVISQTINCEPGCPVTETAVFTTKLWGE